MEIKKSWNQFKKDAKKEGLEFLNGCCYMTAKQISLGTATIYLCTSRSYEDEIQWYCKEINKIKINKYGGWTADRQERGINCCNEKIAFYEGEKQKYGTRENEAKVKASTIVNSKAFKTFCEASGLNVTTAIETKIEYGVERYWLRIKY